jgi:hypothetical protein
MYSLIYFPVPGSEQGDESLKGIINLLGVLLWALIIKFTYHYSSPYTECKFTMKLYALAECRILSLNIKYSI